MYMACTVICRHLHCQFGCSLDVHVYIRSVIGQTLIPLSKSRKDGLCKLCLLNKQQEELETKYMDSATTMLELWILYTI